MLTILCVQKSRRSPRSHHSKGGYIAGRKHSSNSGGGGGRQQPPDFWIVNGQGTARPVGDLEGTVLRDFIHHDSSAVDSPPPRYQTVPGWFFFYSNSDSFYFYSIFSLCFTLLLFHYFYPFYLLK